MNNRKRAIIALIHSVLFLGIAILGLNSAPKTGLFYPFIAVSAGKFAIFFVYLIVTTVLVILTRYSRCARERAYFAFCSASASVGLGRALVGDPVPYLGPISRVLLLGVAVWVGFSILNAHSAVVVSET
ncbi:MAG TPA: hypothetical protein VGL89_03910 [Candidatus Koribacter sp.]